MHIQASINLLHTYCPLTSEKNPFCVLIWRSILVMECPLARVDRMGNMWQTKLAVVPPSARFGRAKLVSIHWFLTSKVRKKKIVSCFRTIIIALIFFVTLTNFTANGHLIKNVWYKLFLIFNMILETDFKHHDNLVNFTVFWRRGGGSNWI